MGINQFIFLKKDLLTTESSKMIFFKKYYILSKNITKLTFFANDLFDDI